MKKKIIIIFFIFMMMIFNTVLPVMGTMNENNLNYGSLSGYVFNITGDYIEGARISVYFHDAYVENYSNSYGYYHVTNIPICFCLKNATVNKDGYKSERILLAIGENTVYNFTLIPTDNLPPDTPATTGPSSGKAGFSYNYSINTIDPDGDEVSYKWDWGNGNYSDWVEDEEATYSWTSKGNFEIRVLARDKHGGESEWSDPFVVSIQKNKANETEFTWLLYRCPQLFTLVQLILNLSFNNYEEIL